MCVCLAHLMYINKILVHFPRYGCIGTRNVASIEFDTFAFTSRMNDPFFSGRETAVTALTFLLFCRKRKYYRFECYYVTVMKRNTYEFGRIKKAIKHVRGGKSRLVSDSIGNTALISSVVTWSVHLNTIEIFCSQFCFTHEYFTFLFLFQTIFYHMFSTLSIHLKN